MAEPWSGSDNGSILSPKATTLERSDVGARVLAKGKVPSPGKAELCTTLKGKDITSG